MRCNKVDLGFLNDVYDHFQAIDADGSGKITYDDIIISMTFDRYDVDGTGRLDRDEFKMCLDELQKLKQIDRVPNEVMQDLYDSADTNAEEGEDKGLDRKEFMTFLLNKVRESNIRKGDSGGGNDDQPVFNRTPRSDERKGVESDEVHVEIGQVSQATSRGEEEIV